LQLSFDIGGTFTDFVLFDEKTGETSIWKVPTTSKAPARAVIDEINARTKTGELQPASIAAVFHATTIATNAILERKGLPTALITTRGFRDIFLIGRQKRYDINNLHLRKPSPLIQRSDVYEVSERMSHDGSVVEAFNAAEARELAKELVGRGYSSVAVAFLHAYANEAHERQMADILRELAPGIEVSLSSHISPKIREYERTSTTVANAYVKPIVRGYLNALERSLTELGIESSISIMQSNGGLVSPELARNYPIRIVESGPAAGVFMCADVGREEGLDHLITFDMGGTTAKLGAIDDGKPAIMPTFEVDAVNYTKGSGLPLNITAIELLEIGAGGGSIASISTGLISVGPQSAGADPGPICYRRGGTLPTITDANVVLGYLNPGFFNGGAITLDLAGAAEGIEREIGRPLGLSLESAAWGIHRIANANMERATRIVSIDRGRDPRRYALVAFGGAGPLHAARLAGAIGIPRVVIPHGAGVGSAFGLLCAEHKSDLAVTRILKLNEANLDNIAKLFAALEARASAEAKQLSTGGAVRIQRSVWMHYDGQGYEIRVDLPEGPIDAQYIARARDAFYAAYKREYGYIDPEADIEGTEWYVIATPLAHSAKPSFKRLSGQRSDALVGKRQAYFPEAGGYTSCSVIDRYGMQPGVRYEGPALIEERESTTIIRPGDVAFLSTAGHIIVEIGKSN
jgi:N-methylhydantoinase A